MQGRAYTSFANPQYIGSKCRTPVTKSMDDEYVETTCLQIEHNSMAFSNYEGYLATWSDAVNIYGNNTNDLATRPKGYALYTDNTTIIAPVSATPI